MSNENQEAQTGIGLNDAASRISAILTDTGDAGPAPEEQNEAEEATEAPADDAEALADTDSDETLEADEADSDAEVEATDTDDEEEGEEDEQPLYTVKIDGKEEQVTLDEALEGYQRQSDYTRKSQALAESRKAHESEVEAFQAEAEAVAAEREQYVDLLQALSKQVGRELDQEPNWDALYKQNPNEFARVRAIWDDKLRKKQAADAELQRMKQVQAQQEQQQLAQLVQSEQQKLLEAVPEWKDNKVFEAERVKIREFGKSIGFTDEELASTFDHRAVLALRMAMRFAEANKGRPTAGKRKGPKPARAGAASQQPGPKTKTASAMKRLAKTGSRADAAAVFKTLL